MLYLTINIRSLYTMIVTVVFSDPESLIIPEASLCVHTVLFSKVYVGGGKPRRSGALTGDPSLEGHIAGAAEAVAKLKASGVDFRFVSFFVFSSPATLGSSSLNDLKCCAYHR